MSLLLLGLFALAGALLVYMFVDLFKNIPRSTELMSPEEQEYVLSALSGSAIRLFIASQRLKVEEDDFRLAQAEWQAHFPEATWHYEISRTRGAVSITLGLRSQANASIQVTLPTSATRADALRIGMAQLRKQWGV